jgi:hypothetical protein
MNLQPHPEAEARFNELAEEVLATIEEVSPESLRTPKPRFEPDTFVSAHLTAKDIYNITHLGTFDPISMETIELLFHTEPGRRSFKLRRQGCGDFDKLAARIAATDPFRKISTRKRVRTAAIDWLSARLGGTTKEPLVGYLLAAIRPTIERFTAIVPIAYLIVEEEFPFGRVTFKPLGSAFFDAIAQQRGQMTEADHRALYESQIQQYRRKRQGYAGAFVDIAEPRTYS